MPLYLNLFMMKKINNVKRMFIFLELLKPCLFLSCQWILLNIQLTINFSL